ncbi:autophagy-related protein ATG11/17 [Acrasis kona]|uniref:Autophagy-related protein ATG11/17 n=1 Tax=Acrasis kona TaxID=1008807 RepID=A0AAW2ZRR2_9EUKA
MKIFQAETGTPVEVFLPPNTSIISLKNLLEESTGISPQDQILLEKDGSVVEAAIRDNYIFMFDRNSFSKSIDQVLERWVDFESNVDPNHIEYPNEIIAAELRSHPLANHAKEFFTRFKQAENFARSSQSCFKYCSRKVQELKIMNEAVLSVVGNLNIRALHMLNQIKAFEAKFIIYDKRFTQLLSTFDGDLEKLKSIELHPSLRSPNRNTLYDTIPHQQIRSWAPKCGVELKTFRERFSSGKSSADSLYKATLREKTAPPVNINEFSPLVAEADLISQKEVKNFDVFKQDYVKLLESLKHPNPSAATPIPPLHHITMNHIQKRIFESKNKIIVHLFNKLRSVSDIQSQVGKMFKKVNAWVTILKNLVAKFNQLEIVQNLPASYQIGLLEVMRRRRIEERMHLISTDAFEKIEKIKNHETEARKKFSKTFTKHLPPNTIPWLSSPVTAPSINITSDKLPNLHIENVDFEQLKQVFGDDVCVYEELIGVDDDHNVFQDLEETIPVRSNPYTNHSKMFASCLANVLCKKLDPMDERGKDLLRQLELVGEGSSLQVDPELLNNYFS